MIIQTLLNLLFGAIEILMKALPTLNVMNTDVFSDIAGTIAVVEYFIPLSSMLTGVTILIGAEVFLFNTWVINWVVQRIPFVG